MAHFVNISLFYGVKSDYSGGHFATFEILILTPPRFTLTTNYTIQKGRLKKKSFFSDNMNIEAQGA